MAVTQGTVYSGYQWHSRVYVSWTKTGESIEKNETYISWTVGINVSSGDQWYNNAVKINATYINGVKVFSGGTYSNIQSNGNHAKASGTATIPHNADGTKSFSASISGWFYSYGNTSTGSNTFELPTIPRATTPTLTPSTVDFGESVTINLPRATDSFTHDLSYSIGAASGTIGTGLGNSKQWTVPLSLAGEVPNSTTGIIAITCNTYNGTTLLGTKTVNLTANVPTTVIPSITGIEYEDVNGYLSKYGGYVQGKSIPKLVISAAAQYSSIKQYKAIYKETTYLSSTNEVQLGVTNEAGTVSVTVNAVDGRERAATLTESITVIPYSAPIVRMVTDRCNADGTLNDEGSYAKASCYIEISPLNNKNGKTATLYYKKKVETEWTKGKEWSSYLINEDVILPADTSYSYDIMLEVSDDFSQPKAVSEFGTAEVILDFNSNGKGMAIGKVSEEDGLEVAWKTKFHSDVSVIGNSVTMFGEAKDEGFIVEGSKPAKFTGNMFFKNNGNYIAGTTKDGKILGMFTPVTDGNVCLLGYGGYAESIGATGIYGNQINLISRDGVCIDGNKMADYIVEQGKTGIWTYQKYSSGIIIMAGRETVSLAFGTSRGNGWYSSKQETVAIPLVTEILSVQMTQDQPVVGTPAYCAVTGNTSIYYAHMQLGSTTGNVQRSFFIVGKWK